jgi:hypothetical protein
MRVRLLALAATTVLLLPLVCRADLVDRVLAVVGGTVITQSDATAALTFGLVRPPAPGVDPLRAALDQLIRREIILAEVDRYAPTESDAGAFRKALDQVQARFPTPALYQAALARTAMSDTRLRDIVEANVRIDDYLKQRFGVAEPTDEEVAQYWAAHRAQFLSGGRQLLLDEARSDVRQRLIDQKREAVIDDWVARLRRRAEVTDLYFADAGR